MKNILKLYDATFGLWVKLPETVRYLLVGGFNTLFYYLAFVLFVSFLGEKHAQGSLFVAFIVASFNSYFTMRTYVFLSTGKWRKEYGKCLGTWTVGYFLNAGLLALLMKKMDFDPYLGEFVAIMITTVVTYFLLKYFAFRKKVVQG